jgi:hypothetical protein
MLGMRITRDRLNRMIMLDQEAYVTKALERFNMNEVRILSTPGAVDDGELLDDMKLNQTSEIIKDEYLRIVGTLLYAATSTRLDIAHAVNQLASHNQSPTVRNLNNAKRVLRYLYGNRKFGLKFGGMIKSIKEALTIEGYSDADSANDPIDRKSISGWIIKLCGCPIVWKSKKQRVVALSTCEAELYALGSAALDIMWLRDLLTELGLLFKSPSTIWCDNQSTVQISKNNIKSERTKHISTKYSFIVDSNKQGIILSQWISTVDQQADILTKSVSRIIFERLRNQLMVTK